VARFLSGAWIDAFNSAVAGVELAAPGPAAGLATHDGSFSVCQVVTGGPGGEVRATLSVRDGRARMAPGDAPADVTIRLSWDDAVAMASGTLSPGDAIAAGRVRVRGDLSVLAESQAVLGALAPHLEPLAAETDYGGPPRVETDAQD